MAEPAENNCLAVPKAPNFTHPLQVQILLFVGVLNVLLNEADALARKRNELPTNLIGDKYPLEVNVWITLPPEIVTVPPAIS
jgi:hypothetical protein